MGYIMLLARCVSDRGWFCLLYDALWSLKWVSVTDTTPMSNTRVTEYPIENTPGSGLLH